LTTLPPRASSGPASDRAFGILLFLPVPLVLWLFTAQPLGVAWSLAVGCAIVATHRLYARPFALARAERRCLWCGSPAAGPSLALAEPVGETTWRTCGEAHGARVGAVLSWASRHGLALRLGIGGSLLILFAMSLLARFMPRLGLLPKDGVLLFRLGVACTVLPLGWLGTRRSPASIGPLPFPVHLQALVGTVVVVWLFRLVGLAWLALGLWAGAQRIAP
jgi:hypothetical protein